MPYLLDTHALMWWWLKDAALSSSAATALEATDGPVYISPVSAIEIAIKVRQGKLPAMREPLLRFDELAQRDSFRQLPVTYKHAREAGLLPGKHRDPFDRLIAAQALLENLTVITRDAEFATFGCETLW